MKFSEVVGQILELLQHQGRVSYRALKREFEIDDDYVEDLKAELIDARQLATDENGKVLVWIGKEINGETEKGGNGQTEGKTGKRINGEGSLASSVQSLASKEQEQTSTVLTPATRPRPLDAVAERRQLTVLFCDLVGSTALSAQLDPEDYRTVVQWYQQTGAAVVERHEGYLAQYLGDGLLVYFGYPSAHEDDARRAVRVGLEIIEAIRGQTGRHALQVRVGIHTGLVVVGDIGAGSRTELLALGETPNIAARIQGLAEPDTVIVSAATQRLIEGQFESQPFGSHLLKGIDSLIAIYHVQSERQSLSPIAGRSTLTPLVGREQEVGLLFDRWEQAKSLELRASISLAQLWQQQSKKSEAHKMLTKIYGWFTEGFDTKDLQEAKALLESLESSV